MKLDTITNKKEMQGDINPNDEFYTPRYAIEPLLKYLKPKSKNTLSFRHRGKSLCSDSEGKWSLCAS